MVCSCLALIDPPVWKRVTLHQWQQGPRKRQEHEPQTCRRLDHGQFLDFWILWGKFVKLVITGRYEWEFHVFASS